MSKAGGGVGVRQPPERMNMLNLIGPALACSLGLTTFAADPVPPRLAAPIDVDGHRLAVPTPAQAAWHDLELGMFIHVAPQTWQDSERDSLKTPLSSINPEKLDTDHWVRVAQSMGAKYIVFVAKHEGGFCWWPTATTDFSVKNTPWRGGKGDVLKDLSASCRAAGMRLGVYLSPQDRKHGIGIGGKADDPAMQSEYESIFRRQLTEVLANYGDLVEVWFDGSLIFDVGDILEKHAPDAMVFQGPQATIRWVGNEDGVVASNAWNTVRSAAAGGTTKWGDCTASDGDPAGDRWLPNECDARIRATWFWRSDNQRTLKSVPDLMGMYEQSVGRGAVLLLNNTPDRSGLIPELDAERAAAFGAEIRRVYGPGSGVADTSGAGRELIVRPSAPATIDRVMIMEEISGGERIRRYEIDGLVGGVWKPLARGEAVGHKRIDRFPPIEVASVRLRITESVGEPAIRRLSLHRALLDSPK
jgi:alpha-L-fucosidase